LRFNFYWSFLKIHIFCYDHEDSVCVFVSIGIYVCFLCLSIFINFSIFNHSFKTRVSCSNCPFLMLKSNSIKSIALTTFYVVLMSWSIGRFFLFCSIRYVLVAEYPMRDVLRLMFFWCLSFFILKNISHLSDDPLEWQIRDRLFFRNFLGINISGTMTSASVHESVHFWI
jgi:hypothetical protein